MNKVQEQIAFVLDYYDILKNRDANADKIIFDKLETLRAAGEISPNVVQVFASLRWLVHEMGKENAMRIIGIIADIADNTAPKKPKIRHGR